MITKEQIQIIINKVKEQNNYSDFMSYIIKNYEKFDNDTLELITDTILETNNLNYIVHFAKNSKNINIEKIINNILIVENTNNLKSIAELMGIARWKYSDKVSLDFMKKILDYIYENIDFKSNDAKDIIYTANSEYKYFIESKIRYREKDTTDNYDAKLQENETLYSEIKKKLEQANKEKAIAYKNEKIKEFKETSKKYEYDYFKSSYGVVNDFFCFIHNYKKYFENDDEQSVVEIMKNVLNMAFDYIQWGNRNKYGIASWNIEYNKREEEYIEKNLKNFLSYFPNRDKDFIDNVLKCLPEMILKFKDIENFPFDKAYEIVKNYDKSNSRNFESGTTLVNYVAKTQEQHQYDLIDLENFVLDSYIPSSVNKALSYLYHGINGVNKERIEDFLFNYGVQYDQSPYKFNDLIKENKIKDIVIKKTLRNLALKDLINYKTEKYSRLQIENAYMKNGVDDSFSSFINYNSKGIGYKKWENYFCEKGTSLQIVQFLDSFNYRYGKDKIDVNRCLNACLNKNDDELASAIYRIMYDFKDANLVYLERLLTATGNEEVIKRFVNNSDMQKKYFEQLLEFDTPESNEQVEQPKRLILMPKKNNE